MKINTNSKSYFLGLATFALAMFLGSKWSPDYFEFISNGNNFLFLVFLFILWIIIEFCLDLYFINKKGEFGETKNGRTIVYILRKMVKYSR